MNVTDFISAKAVIALPTKTNPKVYLAIDNGALSKLSFTLYNPFSIQGKWFKNVSRFLCVYANGLAKMILPKINTSPSSFIKEVSKMLEMELTSSLYIATAKDKVVLQLVSKNSIIGYLKYPITTFGEKRLLNERNAIDILSQEGIVSPLLLKDTYGNTNYIVLQNIEGSIGKVNDNERANLLSSFKKGVSYPLTSHPRVFHLKRKATELHLKNIILKIESLVEESQNTYAEVYEHGDFAPWNIIRSTKGLIPFDFEYFTEKGLEHFDDLKYHFQCAHLLEGKIGADLLAAVKSRTEVEEFSIVFGLFLCKEIIGKNEEGIPCDMEENLIANL